jgi:serine phosphatase RsbU (regulator of sigma subunit)
VRRVGHRARSARRAAAVTAGVGIGALLAPSLPAALAAKDKDTAAAPVVTVEAPPAASTRRAERAAKAEGTPPPPPAPVAAPALPAPGEATAGSRKPPGRAPGRKHHANDGEAPPATATGEASDGGAADAGTAGAATDDVATPDASALARKQKKSGGSEKGGGEKTGGKKRKERELKEREQVEDEREGSSTGEASGGETGVSGKGTPTSIGVEASPTALAATAATPAGTTTPAVGGTAEASLSALAPSTSAAQGLGTADARAKHAARSQRHARRVAAKGAPVQPAATFAAPIAPLVASESGASSGGSAPHPRSGLGGSYSRSSEPAIVHTITKIVGVVPAPMRLLIAALAALALAFGLRSLLTGVRARRLSRQRGELLEDVGLLQAALLPEPPARLGPVGTSVAYRPADGPGAGGDFYDVFALEAGKLATIVGDVSGHGREALPHTALVRFTVRAYLEAGLDPAAALATAGAVLERQLGGSFATVLAAVYDPRERTLTYSAAGHPPPLVLGERDASGALGAIAPVTACSAPPLGAGLRTGTRQTVVSIPGPARLCFHTDGVTEARVGEQREELFGAERLSRSLAELPAQADAAELLDSVATQSSARPDDMAACVLTVHDGEGAPMIASERLELERDSFDQARVQRFLELSGVDRARARASVERTAHELAGSRTATLELDFVDGAPNVTVRGEVVIRAAALSAVGAS